MLDHDLNDLRAMFVELLKDGCRGSDTFMEIVKKTNEIGRMHEDTQLMQDIIDALWASAKREVDAGGSPFTPTNGVRPLRVFASDIVDVKLRNGEVLEGIKAGNLRWGWFDEKRPRDIVGWRRC